MFHAASTADSYNSRDADSYCFNSSAMPANMNSFSINILSNNTMQGELCGFLSATGDGNTKSIVVSCDLRAGSAMWMSGTCNNRAVAPTYYLGFGGRQQIHGPGATGAAAVAGRDKRDTAATPPLFQFMWTIKYDHLDIC